MDLLRLVLARQPIQKIYQLGYWSKPFVLIRSSVIGLQLKEEDLLKSCTANGELHVFSNEDTPIKNLLARAIFLLNADAYLYFLSKQPDEEDVDLWLALSTNIPAIQYAALDYWKNSDSRLKPSYGPYEGIEKINWTPELDAKLEETLGKIDTTKSRPTSLPQAKSEALYLAYRILKGKTEFNRNQAIEKLIKKYLIGDVTLAHIGYFYPLITNKTVNLYTVAVAVISYDLAIYALNAGIEPIVVETRMYVVTRTYREVTEARKFLDDPRTRALLSQSTLAEYRIIAGEITDDVSNLRLPVGNPGPITDDRYYTEGLTAMEIVMYNPGWTDQMAEEGDDLAERMSSALGKIPVKL